MTCRVADESLQELARVCSMFETVQHVAFAARSCALCKKENAILLDFTRFPLSPNAAFRFTAFQSIARIGSFSQALTFIQAFHSSIVSFQFCRCLTELTFNLKGLRLLRQLGLSCFGDFTPFTASDLYCRKC